MRSIILAIAVCVSYIPGSPEPGRHTVVDRDRITVIPFNINGSPVTITDAAAEDSLDVSYVTCALNNLTEDKVTRIHLLVFVVDPDNHLREVQEALTVGALSPRASRNETVEIKTPVGTNGRFLIAVTKVLSSSGVWRVDASQLEATVRAQLAAKPAADLPSSFEAHAQLTKKDRSEIFGLILETSLRDAREAGYLKDSSVILLREGSDIELPSAPESQIGLMNLDEIQKIANVRGRVVYLINQPLTIEGSRVVARIGLRDRVNRNTLHVPFKFTFVFVCVQKDGRWVIEESGGYAQS